MVLSFNDIRKSYRVNQDNVVVLKDINFSIEKGERIAIVGPSGCGKTTILKLIVGIVNPDQGQIMLNRENNNDFESRPLIGYVPQTQTLLPNRTVLKNITLPLDISDLRQTPESLDRLIELFGLKAYLDYYPHQLSVGMRQKVSIAQNLVSQPELLLMDEPMASLDEISRTHYNEEVLNILRDLSITTVLVTHSIEEAVFMSTRIMILSSPPASIIKEIIIKPYEYSGRSIREQESFYEKVIQVRKMLNSYV